MLTKEQKKRGQIQMLCINDLVPEDHLLRKIDKAIDWNFIYELVEDKYCQDDGIPSIDSVTLIKIRLIQYLYGIKSMRQTIKEIEVNVGYRCFLSFDFMDDVPHFTTFGKNYSRRFAGTDIFEQIFTHILTECYKQKFVDPKEVFIDATHVKACANNKKFSSEMVKEEALFYEAELKKEINTDREAHGKKPLKDKNGDDNGKGGTGSNGGSEEQIIKIELDQRRYYKYRNPITLCEYVESVVASDKNRQFYLFIDEVQLTSKVVDKENGNIEVTIYDMLNELKAYKNLDVYVTGSNSKGLSNDIATEFRGRASQIHVYPLSFKEYYSAVGGDERRALDMYILYGGLPRITALNGEKGKKEYLTNLYRELYIKDIVEGHGIEREDLLADILDFLASQISSSLTNPTNIAKALSSIKNEKINPALVSNYVQHIMDSFLISQARRYDVKGKTYFKFPNKYYYTDTGLRNARLNYRQYDPGHLMENVIYNELLRRGYSVDVGVVADRSDGQNVQKEIDFVVNDADRRIYIQSAFRMDIIHCVRDNFR